MKCLGDILAAGYEADPAIEAPGRPVMSYGELRQHTRDLAAVLSDAGVGAADTVALVLPNGPEAATAFLGAATAGTAAPLNPAYTRDEFSFYLEDLDAAALVLLDDDASPAADAAKALGKTIVTVARDESWPAGRLIERSAPAAADIRDPGPDDTALVLHTSGTTARPKIVPLTHANLAASACAISKSLGLTRDDRCLNVMPLFHIHGIAAALLASLSAGGTVICSPGFNALRFMDWLTSSGATWYTAVPTMHQAILTRARRRSEDAESADLRFIRSSSSALPPSVMMALEDVFDAPVIEAYGMTEAAHQMASNPLPPAERKPGTVGIAAGPEVGIMSAEGDLQASGDRGEIVVRGPNIMAGYRANREANASAFSQGWFRTGDEGFLDADGFLTITGRLKEVINRGGEKVSPREVDEVLLDCPGVAQAVTFAVPHKKLGEEVAAVVVPLDGETLTPEAVREYAGQHLAAFKVPRKVVVRDDVPKGATGKVQRISLARQLGLEPSVKQ